MSRPTNWIGNSHENKVVVDSPVTLSPFGVDCYRDASSEEDDEGLYGMNAILCSLIIPSCRCHTGLVLQTKMRIKQCSLSFVNGDPGPWSREGLRTYKR